MVRSMKKSQGTQREMQQKVTRIITWSRAAAIQILKHVLGSVKR